VLGIEDEALERVDAWQAVEAAMASLPERERQILYLRFFEDMSQTEIADEVAVSQMHVSRLLARSISEIRGALGVDEDPEV
ncbi:MAG: sigma-70 family RNA polymerase sigma factor, partial [Acidimicrobiia bacterium]